MTALEATALSARDWYIPPASQSAYATPGQSYLQVAGRSEWGTAPTWLSDAVARITYLQSLGDGWDGYGSSGVNPRLAKAVGSFLSKPLWASTPIPRIVPTSDGGLAVEWRGSGATLELEFDPRGNVDIYVSDSTGTEWEGPLDDEPDGLEKWAWRVAQG